MKFKDLDGFGSLGKVAYDFDLATCSDDDIMRLGWEVFNELVVLVPAECASVSVERFHYVTTMWGDGLISKALDMLMERVERDGWTDVHKETYQDMMRMTQGVQHLAGIIRVTGERDDADQNTGMFAEGELDWHSNQQSDNQGIAPLVGLHSVKGTAKSRTDFLNLHDAYMDLDPDTRSECDEVVTINTFGYDKVSRGTSDGQVQITNLNLAPFDNAEANLVVPAPCGKMGLHFPWTSVVGFKGYNDKEFKRLFNHLIKHCLNPKYQYYHEWTDGDIIWMDQVITLHRRPGDETRKRLLHRLCSDFKIIEARIEDHKRKLEQAAKEKGRGGESYLI